MAGSCVALVTPHEDLAAEVRKYLQQRLGLAVLTGTFETVGNYLSQDTDGLLLAGVADPADQRALAHLIQDIALQELLSPVVVIEREAIAGTVPLSLSPYLVGRVLWPTEADKLTALVKARERCGFPFVDQAQLTVEEVLQRDLQDKAPSLLPLVERLALAARHDVTVLMTGETGTGKTHFARLIHEHSPRRKYRFLQISCGALSANLVESEFFGHVRGAFTGADRTKVGKFAAVGQGTLLLDEIDTLGVKQQAALLRVIETGEFEPVGSIDTQKCKARVIVASNIPLERAVDEGSFRPDLYFRLNVMSFHLPPLRERVQDISPLARSFAARFNRKFDKNLYDIHPQALAALEGFYWPGNIRQLENAVQHAVLVSNGPELLLHHLPEPIQEAALSSPTVPRPAGRSLLDHQRDLSERATIHRALVENGYNRSRAAEVLGISRVTLYKKMEKYGLTEIPVSPSVRAL
jgi:DNA-binding NtrC family response regulator